MRDEDSAMHEESKSDRNECDGTFTKEEEEKNHVGIIP